SHRNPFPRRANTAGSLHLSPARCASHRYGSISVPRPGRGLTTPNLQPMTRQIEQRYRAYQPGMGCQSGAHIGGLASFIASPAHAAGVPRGGAARVDARAPALAAHVVALEHDVPAAHARDGGPPPALGADGPHAPERPRVGVDALTGERVDFVVFDS